VQRRWDPVPLLGLLALSHRERAGAVGAHSHAGGGLAVDERAVLDAFVRQLPPD
jgi:hypothetical protein